MTIEPQYQAADRDEPYTAIGHKRIGINESGSDKVRHTVIVEPKNTPRRHRKGKKTISSVGTGDCGNGPEQEIRPRRISAKLNCDPQDARSCDKPQQG